MQSSKNRGFVFIFIFLVVILILVFRNTAYNRFQTSVAPVPTPVSDNRPVTVIIDLDIKKITSSVREIPASASALTLLEDVTARQNIPLVTKSYSFGTLVESIANLKNTANRAWIYFVNGQSASVGADSYKPAHGDIVEWKYIQPSF